MKPLDTTGIDLKMMAEAERLSRDRFGREVGFYVPGMFVYDGRRGKFPALSLTGLECGLDCLHCKGQLLTRMTPATDPKGLLETAQKAWEKGHLGLLISGGCDSRGRLPWEKFYGALAQIKAETGLTLAVHAGFVDKNQARGLRKAGVDLAMMDVIGDERTAREVYRLESLEVVRKALDALVGAGLEVVPHVVVGLDHGKIQGEAEAARMIAESGAGRIVFVVFMPLKNTAMAGVEPPPVREVINLIVRTRVDFPELVQHLGCAKPRGRYHRNIDRLALRAGINQIAIPAPEAVEEAEELGLTIRWAETCCAVAATDGKE